MSSNIAANNKATCDLFSHFSADFGRTCHWAFEMGFWDFTQKICRQEAQEATKLQRTGGRGGQGGPKNLHNWVRDLDSARKHQFQKASPKLGGPGVFSACNSFKFMPTGFQDWNQQNFGHVTCLWLPLHFGSAGLVFSFLPVFQLLALQGGRVCVLSGDVIFSLHSHVWWWCIQVFFSIGLKSPIFFPESRLPELNHFVLKKPQAMGQNTSMAVLEAVNTMTGGAFPMKDPLDAAGSCVFDDKAWQKFGRNPLV